MKNKLRKLVIGSQEYFWKLTTKYREINSETKDYRALVEVTVYRSGMKNTPLIVQFDVPDDPVLGTKITSSGSEVNLHQPSYVRMVIEAGLEQGWAPDIKPLTIKDGIKVLGQRGIDIGNI